MCPDRAGISGGYFGDGEVKAVLKSLLVSLITFIKYPHSPVVFSNTYLSYYNIFKV